MSKANNHLKELLWGMFFFNKMVFGDFNTGDVNMKRPYMHYCMPETNAAFDKWNGSSNVMKIVVKEYFPFLTVDKSMNVCGSLGLFIHDFVGTFDIKYRFVNSSSPAESGVEFANGSWNGIMGMLEKEEASLSLRPLSATVSRSKVTKFSAILDYTYTAILTKNGDASQWIFAITDTLDEEVWAGIPVLIILTALLFTVSDRVHRSVGHGFLQNIWAVFSCICLQGQSKIRRFSSWRICLVAFLLLPMMLMTQLQAALLSSLFYVVDPNNIDTVEQLLTRTQMRVATISNTAFAEHLQTGNAPQVTQLLSKRVNSTKGYISWKEMMSEKVLQEVEQGKTAIISSNHKLEEMQNERQICTFHIGSEELFPSFLVLMLSKSFPKNYADWIDQWLMKMKWSGLWNEFKENVVPNIDDEQRCLRKAEFGASSFAILQFEGFYGIFSLYLSGIAVSIAVLILELVYHRSKQKWASIKSVPQHKMKRRKMIFRGLADVPSSRHQWYQD